MAYASMGEMKAAIVAELTEELKDRDSQFNAKVLANKVDGALRELRMRRNYADTALTEEQILADMTNFYHTIREVALVDYAKQGAYGESYHYENTVHRSYIDREELFQGVHAFVKVLI